MKTGERSHCPSHAEQPKWLSSSQNEPQSHDERRFKPLRGGGRGLWLAGATLRQRSAQAASRTANFYCRAVLWEALALAPML